MREYLKGLVSLTVQCGSVTKVDDRIKSFAHRCLPPEQALIGSGPWQELGGSSACDVQRYADYLAIVTQPWSIFFVWLWLPGHSERCRHLRCPNTSVVVFLDLVWVHIYVARR